MANLGYMQLVRHCNQYCRFCSNPSTGYMLDLDTAKREIDDFAERGYFGVILTGANSDGALGLARIKVKVCSATAS